MLTRKDVNIKSIIKTEIGNPGYIISLNEDIVIRIMLLKIEALPMLNISVIPV
ncbi:hypothetical protein ES708_33024 [subsurface metagenome]